MLWLQTKDGIKAAFQEGQTLMMMLHKENAKLHDRRKIGGEHICKKT